VRPGGCLVVEGAGLEAAVVSRSLRMNRAMTIFFFPDARVSGEVAAPAGGHDISAANGSPG
jgi:hypothetical protein